MLLCMIGMAHLAMTVDIQRAQRTPTTAVTVKMTTAPNVPHIAGNARRRSVWAAVDSVRTARSRGAETVSADVLSVKNYVVNHVLKMTFVQTV